MVFFEYMMVLIAAVGQVGVGRWIISSRDPGRWLLAGLVLSSCLATPIAWKATALTIPFLRTITVLGLVSLLWHYRSLLRFETLRTCLAEASCRIYIFAFILVTAVFALFFIRLQLYFFDYLTEVMAYFPPIIEVFLADYLSNLRVPTYYPAEMAGIHLVPMMVFAVLGSFLPTFTLFHGVEILYLVLVFFFARFFFLVWKEASTSWWQLILTVAALLYLCFPEMKDSVLASSYLYMLLLMEIIALALLAPNTEPPESIAMAALFFAIAMIISKLTIAIVPAIVAFYFIAVFPKQRLRWPIVLIAVVVVINAAVVLSLPLPFGDQNIGFSLANPFKAQHSFYYFYRFGDALFNKNSFSEFFEADIFIGIFIIFLYAIFKYYLLPMSALQTLMTARKRLGDGEMVETERHLVRGVEVLLLSGMVAWTLVRNTDHFETHQSLNFIFGAVAMIAVLSILACHHKFWKWRVGILAMAAVYALSGYSPKHDHIGRYSEHSLIEGRLTNVAGMSFHDFRAMAPEKALTRQDGEPASLVGLRSALLGKRLMASDVSYHYSGKLAPYISNLEKRQ